MTQWKRIGICLAILTLAFGAVMGLKYPSHSHAQGSQFGASVPIGFFAQATNASAPTTVTGAAGTVTNPASNFVLQVDGGPVYCLGSNELISESNITLAASTTFMIVYSCPQNLVYAKVGVTAPGTGATPGTPATLLFPAAGEIALATVVCNATACGNGGNGTITDARTASLFPSGALQYGRVTFANLPTLGIPIGTTLFCTDCTTANPCAGAGAGHLAVRQTAAVWMCN